MNQIEKTLTSMEVAKMIEREHNDLLKTIRTFVSHMNKIAEGGNSHGSKDEYFRESTYEDANGQSRPCFNVTKKGCEFIAHKMKGIKGTEFTMRYIDRFYEMEDTIRAAQLPQTPMELLELHYQAIKQVDNKVNALSDDLFAVKKDLEDFKNDMPILGIEETRITNAVKKKGVHCLGGKESNAYNNRSLRSRLYCDLHAQLRREFGVTSYKAIKRNQTDTAIAIVEAYEPPLVLSEMIEYLNSQITFDDLTEQ